MGKKFVIMEIVEHLSRKFYIPAAGLKDGDCTWIDPRHVIDGERLRLRKPRHGETYFDPSGGVGWTTWFREDAQKLYCLILDPSKEEKQVDDWEEWVEDAPCHAVGFGLSQIQTQIIKGWLRRMPRGK